MSPPLICPQLAVNCVGERGEKEGFLDLLPVPLAQWFRSAAGFSPVREYKIYLLVSSAAAALYIELCSELDELCFHTPSYCGIPTCGLCFGLM